MDVQFCNTVDCSPPGSYVHGVSQARILEWVGFPSPGHLPNPGIEPMSPELQVDSFSSEPPETQVQYLGREDPLEKEVATHSSILAWETP